MGDDSGRKLPRHSVVCRERVEAQGRVHPDYSSRIAQSEREMHLVREQNLSMQVPQTGKTMWANLVWTTVIFGCLSDSATLSDTRIAGYHRFLTGRILPVTM